MRLVALASALITPWPLTKTVRGPGRQRVTLTWRACDVLPGEQMEDLISRTVAVITETMRDIAEDDAS